MTRFERALFHPVTFCIIVMVFFALRVAGAF